MISSEKFGYLSFPVSGKELAKWVWSFLMVEKHNYTEKVRLDCKEIQYTPCSRSPGLSHVLYAQYSGTIRDLKATCQPR